MKRKKQIKLDIHNLKEVDAYCVLLEVLNSETSSVKSILVIHGYHGGVVLKNMVNDFLHHKIDYILPSFSNEGETTIYLK